MTTTQRGDRTWTFASRTYYGALSRFNGPMHDLALHHLGLEAGDSVLDIGCGTGATLAALRDAVGPSGRVVGVDYNAGMVDRTRKFLRRKGIDAEVREADATREPHGYEEFDAMIAITAFNAMPDVPAALRLAHDALRPGGRLFVFDVRLVPSSGFVEGTITRLLRFGYRKLTAFTGADIVDEVERVFGTVDRIGVTPRLTILLAHKKA
ncbi:methyltransferase family protein [Herbihabitans rhizosphaerae]|uniref:Methyltransferase family protein n=1 Tax=Herbihabitans rhizosphaerae TaxID=1872711 RepID=A0A4Q7KG75_9PSEU|nr:class I SAM-dependent methyltransferase [Herbihabitans rhizosphaerae]RZS34079.1 methyltransferase family protein [Herbihabitans rhizosphaerae]